MRKDKELKNDTELTTDEISYILGESTKCALIVFIFEFLTWLFMTLTYVEGEDSRAESILLEGERICRLLSVLKSH